MSHACGDQFIFLCRVKRFPIVFLLACLFVLFMHQGSVSAAEAAFNFSHVRPSVRFPISS